MNTVRRSAIAGVAVLATVFVSAAGWAADPTSPFAVDTPGAVAVAQQPLAGTRVMQSFAADFRDPRGRLYFIQQQSAASADLLITQTDLHGVAVAGGTMTLLGAGHGRGIGVQRLRDGRVFLFTEAEARPDENGKLFGTAIARFQWKAGTTVDLSERSAKRGHIKVPIYRVPQCVFHVSPSVDQEHGQVGVSCGDADHRRHFSVWPLDGFVAGDVDYGNAPRSGDWPALQTTGQGWALFGDYVYELEGDTYAVAGAYPGNTTLKSINIDTHEEVGPVPVGGDPPDSGYVEPEGIGVIPYDEGNGLVPHLAYGVASGPGGARLANVIVKTQSAV